MFPSTVCLRTAVCGALSPVWTVSAMVQGNSDFVKTLFRKKIKKIKDHNNLIWYSSADMPHKCMAHSEHCAWMCWWRRCGQSAPVSCGWWSNTACCLLVLRAATGQPSGADGGVERSEGSGACWADMVCFYLGSSVGLETRLREAGVPDRNAEQGENAMYKVRAKY